MPSQEAPPAPVPASGPDFLPGSSPALRVTAANVLQARAVLLAEAESFLDFLRRRVFVPDLGMGLCGGDPISADARGLFLTRLRENAGAPAQRYVRELVDVADRLAEVAKAFGYTEEQIAGSFRSADPAAPG